MTKKGYITLAMVLTAVFMWLSDADLALADNGGITGRTLYTYGETQDLTKVDLLIATLGSEDRHLRRIAARALGKIGDSRAVKPLIAILSNADEDPGVRSVAAWSLGSLNAGQAMAHLSAALQSDDRRVRLQAKSALSKIAAYYAQLAEKVNG